MPTIIQQSPKIAIIELNSQGNILANLIRIEQGIQSACQHHANLIVLPENAFCFGEQHKASQYFDELFNWCQQISRHYQIYLLAGTLPCQFRPDGTPVTDGKLRQVSILFDPAGDCVARYDKIHLFKATVNDSTGNYDEGRTFEAGQQLVVAHTELGNIGMMICFDVRFAPLAIRLRQMGADILTVPSAFTYITGRAHWESLLTARALDSQCLVVGAGQTGEHFFSKNQQIISRKTWGHSQFINANGKNIGEDIILNQTIDWQTLPFSQSATSWLSTTEVNNFHELSPLPLASYLTIAEFQQEQQEEFRNHINLFASQKLTILDTHL